MPFRSGLWSGVRGPLYGEAAGTARGGVAPRWACARPAAIPIVSKPVAPKKAGVGFLILTRESLPHALAFGTAGASVTAPAGVVTLGAVVERETKVSVADFASQALFGQSVSPTRIGNSHRPGPP